MNIIKEYRGYIPQENTIYDFDIIDNEPQELIYINNHTYIIEERFSPYDGAYEMTLIRKIKNKPWIERIECYTSDYIKNWSIHGVIYSY